MDDDAEMALFDAAREGFETPDKAPVSLLKDPLQIWSGKMRRGSRGEKPIRVLSPPLPLISPPPLSDRVLLALTGFGQTLPAIEHNDSCPATPEPLQDLSACERYERIRLMEQSHKASTSQLLVYARDEEFGEPADTQSLTFDSNFESGNLETAHRLFAKGVPACGQDLDACDQTYELHCSVDTHTEGHIQW
jgi:hypothetical protein